MLVIDGSGNYAYLSGTKKPMTSEHPVYRARIEVALGVGEWIGAPAAGHQLARFKRAAATPHNVEEFQKELRFYLSAYSPTVVDTLLARGGVSMDLAISDEALNAAVSG